MARRIQKNLDLFRLTTSADKDESDIAETILNTFIQTRDSLCEFPDRGCIPPELKRVNILSYREMQVLRYRVIYQINKASREVHVHVVAGERRNFTEFLNDRLLAPSSKKSDKQ